MFEDGTLNQELNEKEKISFTIIHYKYVLMFICKTFFDTEIYYFFVYFEFLLVKIACDIHILVSILCDIRVVDLFFHET